MCSAAVWEEPRTPTPAPNRKRPGPGRDGDNPQARLFEKADDRVTAAAGEAQQTRPGDFLFQEKCGEARDEEPFGHDLGSEAERLEDVVESCGDEKRREGGRHGRDPGQGDGPRRGPWSLPQPEEVL